MTFDEKLAAAKDLLASKGIWRAVYAPTVVALLWRVGFKIPPPHFAGFFGTFVFSGTVLGGAWGVLMWLLWWRHDMSPAVAVGVSVVAGLLVGLCVASYYRYAAHKYAIPAWEDFPGGERRH
jgi:Family of unknown function (DUF6404)